MTLTATTAMAAKPKEKAYKLSDSGSLYLFIHPSGSKTWRWKYRFNGKERIYTIGKFSNNDELGYTLAQARIERDKARHLLKSHIDPTEHRTRQKIQAELTKSATFELITRAWWENKREGWKEGHAKDVLKSLERDIFPALGKWPIKEISAQDLLKQLRIIEGRGALEIASKVLQRCNSIYRFAIIEKKADYNPAADLRGVLKVRKTRNHPHLKANELPEFLQKLSRDHGFLQTRLATKFIILTFVRTGELRRAKWRDINFEKHEWRIQEADMKKERELIVPLSSQCIEILEELKQINANSEFVFASVRDLNKPISENAILTVIKRLGYKKRATGHGFRTTASTILNEIGFTADAIERQLAHGEDNKIRAVYNKAQYLEERRKMMQCWGDYIDSVERQDNVIVGAFGSKKFI